MVSRGTLGKFLGTCKDLKDKCAIALQVFELPGLISSVSVDADIQGLAKIVEAARSLQLGTLEETRGYKLLAKAEQAVAKVLLASLGDCKKDRLSARILHASATSAVRTDVAMLLRRV